MPAAFVSILLTILPAVASVSGAADRERLVLRATPGKTEPVLAGAPVYHAPEARHFLAVDGYLGDWDGAPALTLGPDAVVRIPGYQGRRDLSAEARVQWDERYLYVAVQVTDDVHRQRHCDGFLYMDDSVLLGIAPMNRAAGRGVVFGMALTPAGELGWWYQRPGASQGPADDVLLSVRRRRGITRYECALPWSALAPVLPVAMQGCRFSVLVTDRDEPTRRRHEYLAWTPGLTTPYDPERYGTLLFEPAKLRSYQSPRFFVTLPRTVAEKGDSVAVKMAVNAGAKTSVQVTVALIHEATQTALLTKTLSLPVGVSRYTLAADGADLLPGPYRFLVTVRQPEGAFLLRRELPFRIIDLAAVKAAVSRLRKHAAALSSRDETAEVAIRAEAALALLRRGREDGLVPATVRLSEDMLAEAKALLTSAEGPGKRLDRRVGWVARGYHSSIDDSYQPYLMRVPADYDPRRAYPLIVSLHYLSPGLTRADWVAREFRQTWATAPRTLPVREPVLELHPFGRGNNWYRGLGENDVMQAIAAAQRRYRIDADRVYLTGASMGGTGTWFLAARHPELFAAIAPLSGHLEYAYDSPDAFGDSTAPRWPRSFKQADSPFFVAANLFNVPVYCCHGREDEIVPVYQAENMVRRLRELRYEVEYHEYPQVGHGGFPPELEETVRRWLLGHRRPDYPKRAVVRTSTLEHNQCYWLRIDRLDRMYQFAQVQAEVTGREINAFAWGVREFTILTSRCGFRPGDPLTVNVMRKPVWSGAAAATGELTFRRRDADDGAGWQFAPEGPRWRQPEAPLLKRHGLQGPLWDVYNGPLVIVYGTTAGQSVTALLKQEAEADQSRVNRWYTASFRVIPDIKLTPALLEQCSLILYGGPEANQVTALIADELPLRLDGGAIKVGSRRIPGADVATKFIYPNPLNRNRYVVVNMGVLPAALRGSGSLPWGLWDPLPDYVVFRNRASSPNPQRVTAAEGNGSLPPPEILAEGMFDDAWQVVEDSPLVVWRTATTGG